MLLKNKIYLASIIVIFSLMKSTPLSDFSFFKVHTLC